MCLLHEGTCRCHFTNRTPTGTQSKDEVGREGRWRKEGWKEGGREEEGGGRRGDRRERREGERDGGREIQTENREEKTFGCIRKNLGKCFRGCL